MNRAITVDLPPSGQFVAVKIMDGKFLARIRIYRNTLLPEKGIVVKIEGCTTHHFHNACGGRIAEIAFDYD